MAFGGLQPWKKILRARRYRIAAAYATSLFKGDAVARIGDGTITIATLATTNAHLGAALAFFDINMNPINYFVGSAASAGGFALVADHPDQEFIIAEDTDTSQLAIANEHSNVILVQTAAGDTSTGLSGMEIDSSSVAADVGHQYRLVELARLVGNQVYSATLCPRPKWIVRMNFAQERPYTVGII